MNEDATDDLAGDIELTTKEAAAYLSGPVGNAISPKLLYGLRALGRGPVVEKRGRSLAYRRSTLDAFLRENGSNPLDWMAGVWRNVADQYAAAAGDNPELRSEELIETLKSQENDDWDPDQAQ